VTGARGEYMATIERLHHERLADRASWPKRELAPLLREALEGYERGMQGPGQHTFAELLAATQASVIRFEMRDSYDETEQGFAEWKATGDVGAYDWGDHLDVIRAAVARGVTIRRIRVVSEPLSDYLRWEHACTAVNIEAGEDIRWLSPHQSRRPDASRRRLLRVRPPGRAVELPARRRHQPPALHLQLRPPNHPRYRRRVRAGLEPGNP
jgi:hypothetical protein